jgi:hypothetical protein
VSRKLGAIQFPLSSGRQALSKFRDVFAKLDKKLDRAVALKDKVAERQLAHNVSVKVYQSLPLLGFILRSTNVRNAFELLDPLQNIADAVLQGKPQLLLSSEWDYVPFAYPQSLEDIKSFVLIGMPASEAASALLLPLAGHELGHAVWRNRGIGGSANAKIQASYESAFDRPVNLKEFKKQFPEYDPEDIVYNQLLPEAISRTAKYAAFQAEELFCDIFAYALFGESYLHAFAYILAPGSGVAPGSRYPSHKKRIDVLRQVATKEGVTLPEFGSLGLTDQELGGDPRERFLLKMAALSVDEVIETLWTIVNSLVVEANVRRPNPANMARHLHEIRMGIPAHDPACLGDIINAGWTYFHEVQSGKIDSKSIGECYDSLNEIMLKTIEVLEFRRRTSNDH